MRGRRRISTLDVSIIGGDAESYYHPKLDKFKLGEFLWVHVEGEEHEKLVKVRGINHRVSDRIRRLVSYRRAHPDNVKKVMRNMAKAYLWEKESEPFKFANVSLDVDKGILKIDYIAEKKLNLHVYGAELAKLLHVRVELTQIGARDFAAQIGWLEPCGLIACCKTFLKGKLPSVTIDMARRQYLFAGPEKLTGACGRLYCCLTFELDFYDEMSKRFPKKGAKVKTERGVGIVEDLNFIKGYFKIKYEGGEVETINLEENMRWYVVDS